MSPIRFSSVIIAALCLSVLPTGRAADLTFMLPPATIVASGSSLAEDAAVGPNNQPEWTEHRRFSATRVYLQQEPWEIGLEQWWRARSYDDGQPEHRFSEELEIGLPHRFQLDLYWNWAHDAAGTHHDEFSVELRHALADWGKIWGNPTLYAEYAFVNPAFGGDTLEWKLLLGDDLGKRWHWGVNFIYEGELGQERSQEAAISGGLSCTIIDQVLSAGVEMQWKHETVAGGRSDPEVQFEVGPSIQWRPTKNTHLDLVALFGTTTRGPRVESFVVLGWDLGSAGNGKKGYTPVSTAVHP